MVVLVDSDNGDDNNYINNDSNDNDMIIMMEK